MKFTIENKYVILKVEEKVKVNLYHLIDLDTGDKVTALGVKSDKNLNNLDVVFVTLSLSVKSERIETQHNGVKYLQVVNTFVSKIEKVSA